MHCTALVCVLGTCTAQHIWKWIKTEFNPIFRGQEFGWFLNFIIAIRLIIFCSKLCIATSNILSQFVVEYYWFIGSMTLKSNYWMGATGPKLQDEKTVNFINSLECLSKWLSNMQLNIGCWLKYQSNLLHYKIAMNNEASDPF